MKKVIIDKNFFELNSAESQGLISGLKKLSDNNFEIIIPGFDTDKENVLKQIFVSEGLTISTVTSPESDNVTFITLSNSKSANTICVGARKQIKNFGDAAAVILSPKRTAERIRNTKETQIKIKTNLEGTGKYKIKTGIGFFDHMLEQIARHGNIDLQIKAKGDLQVDEHHTVEDTGILLGETILEALGNKKGITRYGFVVPMDDSVAVCALDLGGRTYLNFKPKFKRELVGEFPTELVEEFFRGLASGLKANIYLHTKGDNDHHKIESLFKAFAKALNDACRIDERNNNLIPSTKGIL